MGAGVLSWRLGWTWCPRGGSWQGGPCGGGDCDTSSPSGQALGDRGVGTGEGRLPAGFSCCKGMEILVWRSSRTNNR